MKAALPVGAGFHARPGNNYDIAPALSQYCDCAVMLTTSDWYTEPVSNRYHYATRLSKLLPVIFVQPDLENPGYRFQATDFENITVLHVFSQYGREQTELINLALDERACRAPLLWMYNALFLDFYRGRYSPLKVFHATEDFFSFDSVIIAGIDAVQDAFAEALAYTELLISVSEAVEASCIANGNYHGARILAENGCDYAFWGLNGEETARLTASGPQKRVLYQGGINFRLDYGLLLELCTIMPDWEFVFAGGIGSMSEEDQQKLAALRALKNARFTGQLSIAKVRAHALSSSIGLIPYLDIPLIRLSFPLKAFEYAANGMPVISTSRIRSLEKFAELFSKCETAAEAKAEIERVYKTRCDRGHIAARLAAAKAVSYDERFARVSAKLAELLASPESASAAARKSARRNVLCLMDRSDLAMKVTTTQDYVGAFARYLPHNVHFAHAIYESQCLLDLNEFDAVLILYSIKLYIDGHLSESFEQKLKTFGGYKVLFLQDDYEYTELVRRAISRLGIHRVFTIVPEKYIPAVYPPERFPYAAFSNVLTGYVAESAAAPSPLPFNERKIWIGYRGRPLPYWLGKLGQEKITIGQRVKELCAGAGIPHDIEWEEDKRIYGGGWHAFIASCRAMLATPSGASVFDDTGELRRNIERELARNPGYAFEEAFEAYLKPHEGVVKTNQVSPKMFEAIALRTALIMFEDEYSGVLRPNEHYIPLKRDYSNIDEVFAKVRDCAYLEALTGRACRDIVLSGAYSYKKYMEYVSACLAAAPHGAWENSAARSQFDAEKDKIDSIFFKTVARRYIRGAIGRTLLKWPPLYRFLKSIGRKQ